MSITTDKLANLPSRPGVYLMRDEKGKVIYVGKAKDLRGRVRAYFNNPDERSQIQFLVRRVADVETLVTSNNKEALILENNLIKQYKPRYNIRLKDDKSYLSIKVTTQHAWPRIFTTRKIVKDGNRYFGPFASAVAARETLDIVEKHFLLRNCTENNFKNRSRPCLQYQIKRCLAPCVLPVSQPDYQERVRQAILFIEGKQNELLTELRQKMAEKSETLEFEAFDNEGLMTMGGAGVQAAQLVVQKGAHALITGNLGPNAASALSASGIKVYLVPGGTVKDVIEDYRAGTLREAAGATVPPHFGMGGGRGMGGRRGF